MEKILVELEKRTEKNEADFERIEERLASLLAEACGNVSSSARRDFEKEWTQFKGKHADKAAIEKRLLKLVEKISKNASSISKEKFAKEFAQCQEEYAKIDADLIVLKLAVSGFGASLNEDIEKKNLKRKVDSLKKRNEVLEQKSKNIGAIVHDALLSKKYLTEKDEWCDAHERLGIPIADIARQERKKTNIKQEAMEQRVRRGIAESKAKRIKMNSNYG